MDFYHYMMFYKQGSGGARSNKSFHQLVTKLLHVYPISTRGSIYKYPLSTHLTFLDSFNIPPPPRLLTPGSFFHSQERGEYYGFGPHTEPGALSSDSTPNMHLFYLTYL
jgi:hypothetical protein